jgi:uncharacterized membrane protein YbjE (DUF340 family)
MFSGLFIILLPLIVGYLIPLHRESALRLINRFLSWIVYVILFFMGISLAFLDNLAAICWPSCIILSSPWWLFCCAILPPCCGWNALFRGKTIIIRKIAFPNCNGAGIIKTVRRGGARFSAGLTGWAFLQHATEASEYTLIFLLFLIGIQLRNNGMTLKQIVLNRRGMMVAVVVLPVQWWRASLTPLFSTCR